MTRLAVHLFRLREPLVEEELLAERDLPLRHWVVRRHRDGHGRQAAWWRERGLRRLARGD
jgi:hypothetical protein